MKISVTAAKNLFLVIVLAAVFSGCAAPKVLVIKSVAPYKEGIEVRQNIREECGLERDLPDMVQLFSRKRYDEILRLEEIPADTTADVLTMKIVNVDPSLPIGVLSRKSVTAEGVLTRNGTPIGSFTAFHYGSGALMPGYHGECSMLRLAIKGIGKSVAKWLINPEMNSTIGHNSKKRNKRRAAPSTDPEPEEDMQEEQKKE